MIRQLELVAGIVLLALCCGFFGAMAVQDAEWRLAERRRRRRRERVEEIDLTRVRL